MISVPARRAAERFILKLNPPEYPHVVENEAFFLELSRACGLPTVQSRVLRDRNGIPGLLVTRFDRVCAGSAVRSLPVEDGCQVLGRWPADKYSIPTEDVFTALAELCPAALVAARDLFRQLCFALLTGNGDLHAKNVAVLGGDEWRIAPAYDLPSTAFYADRSLALSVGGKRTGISRRILLDFAEHIGLRRLAARKWLDDLLDGTSGLVASVQDGALPFAPDVAHDAARTLRNNRRLLQEGE
jgi:serine/threonine-protein kinase HipA